MGLRKSHAKKANPRVHNSGLFGIIDEPKSTNQMKNSEASFPAALNFKARKSVQEAMLEGEYRKTQAITLTRQMRYV